MIDFTGVSPILEIGTKIIDRIFQDPGQRATVKLELYKAQQSGDFSDSDQRLKEAFDKLQREEVDLKYESVFISGWRPFIGWICGIAFALKFIIGPVFSVAMSNIGVDIVLPSLDSSELTAILAGMLGIGGLRTIEKIKGVRIDSYEKIKNIK